MPLKSNLRAEPSLRRQKSIQFEVNPLEYLKHLSIPAANKIHANRHFRRTLPALFMSTIESMVVPSN